MNYQQEMELKQVSGEVKQKEEIVSVGSIFGSFISLSWCRSTVMTLFLCLRSSILSIAGVKCRSAMLPHLT